MVIERHLLHVCSSRTSLKCTEALHLISVLPVVHRLTVVHISQILENLSPTYSQHNISCYCLPFDRRLTSIMAPFDIIETRNSSMDGPVVSLDDNAYRSCAANVTLSSVSTPVLSTPHEIYDGGYAHASERGVLVRIANGTAGQVGLLRAWADSFIQHMVDKGEAPFQVRVSFSTILI